MSKDEQGRSVYVNLWPSAVDIEKRIYRPVLLQILPFVGALFARIATSIVSFITSRFYRGFLSFHDFWITESAKDQEPIILSIDRDMSAHLNQSLERSKPVASTFAQDIVKLSDAIERTKPAVSNIAHDIANIGGSFEHADDQHDARIVARIAYMLNMRLSGDFIKVIFGSLAYSLLIFFIGFTIVQIIVFSR
jgi:hypothetical protein